MQRSFALASVMRCGDVLFLFALVVTAAPADSHTAAPLVAPTATCSSCHVRVAADYARSMHATARSNDVFAAAVRFEDPAWCVSCHASGALDDRGVACASCHTSDVDVRDPALCARCHQFGFRRRTVDGAPIGVTDPGSARDAQQNTFAEWASWKKATSSALSCVDCHMKRGDHSFGRDRRIDALRDAIVVDVRNDALQISLREVGHEMPTGDIMRFISVEAARDDRFDDPIVVARFRRDIAFRVWPNEDAPRLGVTRDVRIPAIGFVDVALPRGMRAWRLVYHLVSEQQEREGLLDVDLSRIELHRGTLP